MRNIKRFLSKQMLPVILLSVGFGGATATVQGQYEEAKQQHQESQNVLQHKNEDLEKKVIMLQQQNEQLQSSLQQKDVEMQRTSQQLQDAQNKIKQTETSQSSSDNTSVRTIHVKATAYSADPAENGGTSGGKVLTKTGFNLTDNPDAKVIAVDPNVIPLGSTVWVEGYGNAKAIDTGSAIHGNHIDIFINNKHEMNQWGVRDVQVKILSEGQL